MNEKFAIPAIGEIKNPDEIRVVIFINGQFVHVPLNEILKSLKAQIDDLDARVTALEP